MSRIHPLTKARLSLLRALQSALSGPGDRAMIRKISTQSWSLYSQPTANGWHPGTFHSLVKLGLASYHQGDHGGQFITLTQKGFDT